MNEEKTLIINLIADLAYAKGSLEGLGHPSKYIADRLELYKQKFNDLLPQEQGRKEE